MLKKLRDRFLDELEKHGIEYAETYGRTSNVFYTNGELWVEKDPEKVAEVAIILAQIKREVDYENPLYHTGILMPRDSFQRLKDMGFEIETDEDLFKLVQSERFIEELKEKLGNEDE